MTTRSCRRLSLALGVLALATGMGGCASDYKEDSQYAAVRADLTPELMTLAERPVDVDSQRAVTFNTNWRILWQDLNRMWLLDRPSRLTPEPMAH